MEEVKINDGDECTGVSGWCAQCNWTFGGSMEMRRAIYLDGKFYHSGTCFSAAIQTYLAKQKLKEFNAEGAN